MIGTLIKENKQQIIIIININLLYLNKLNITIYIKILAIIIKYKLLI